MTVKEDLLKQLETVDGESLAPHFERGALIFVGDNLDIVDVGVAFANDNKEAVTEWLQNEDIWKCTEKERTDGVLAANEKYQFLILQPFVLAKSVATQ